MAFSSNSIDLSALVKLQTEILGQEQKVLSAARMAINHGARKGVTLAVDQITREYVVKPSYIRKHLWRNDATNARLEAVISGTHRETLINRFAKPITHTAPAKYPRRSKGNRRAGVPAGRKVAGITTQVRRGNAHRWQSAFWLPLQSGSGARAHSGANGLGVAIRENGKLKVLHTISVAKIWRRVRGEILPDVQAEAETEFNRQIARLT